MKEWHEQIRKAQLGDIQAFGEVVREFQAMAVGYAYSILRGFEDAEDVAQEAFIKAYTSLRDLREPKAFPGWLRRIVFTQCTRLTRGKEHPTVPLEDAREVPSAGPSPSRTAEVKEMQEHVLDAIDGLPEREREATTLFYIDGYSQAEVGEFLEVPVTTVKNRLRSARGKLKGRVMGVVDRTLKDKAPRDDFGMDIAAVLEQAKIVVATMLHEMPKEIEGNDDFFAVWARMKEKQKDALVGSGFTEEQAVQIVVSEGSLIPR